MENLQSLDIVEKLKHVIAENRSLATRLEEYKLIVEARDTEIDMLHTMVSEANAMRSSLDNDLLELESLKEYMGQIKTVAATAITGASYFGQNENKSDQLKNMKEQHARLQMQATEMEIELRELSNRNMLLQQQNSRLGELESLLEITEKERDDYKHAAERKK